MHRPDKIERLYLDFDGFFASVEQQVHPYLRGRPVGVIPFAEAEYSCVIACSREAKLAGVKNVMSIREARARCPDIRLVPQSPDLYRRAHNALISEISTILPVEAVKSIDELTCRVAPADRDVPEGLGRRIKARLAKNIGPYITCSIGFAANRQLAKMACKAGKPNGNMVWHPVDMPGPLLALPLRAVPGIGTRMEQKLFRAGITSMASLLTTVPKQLRQLWGNVTGERLWYALRGYDVQTPRTRRAMYGHSRVLPPTNRSLDEARAASRLLLTKAARRMRRDGWNAGRVALWLDLIHSKGAELDWREKPVSTFSHPALVSKSWQRTRFLPSVQDDQAVLAGLAGVWEEARTHLPAATRVLCLGVALFELTRARERQLDLLIDDDPQRRQWERLTEAIDALNQKYGRTLVSVGPWIPPPGGYAGGKISYTRVPRAEDFW